MSARKKSSKPIKCNGSTRQGFCLFYGDLYTQRSGEGLTKGLTKGMLVRSCRNSYMAITSQGGAHHEGGEEATGTKAQEEEEGGEGQGGCHGSGVPPVADAGQDL